MTSYSNPKHQVLFLCSGNSCRSQIAEAIVNHLLGGYWNAFSAGTNPAGYVHPNAVNVLKEFGINHKGHSKHMDELRAMVFDLVVTVCDSAAQNCPTWLATGKRIHISFPDPASVKGSDSLLMDEFRKLLDDMQTKLIPLMIKLANDAIE